MLKHLWFWKYISKRRQFHDKENVFSDSEFRDFPNIKICRFEKKMDGLNRDKIVWIGNLLKNTNSEISRMTFSEKWRLNEHLRILGSEPINVPSIEDLIETRQNYFRRDILQFFSDKENDVIDFMNLLSLNLRQAFLEQIRVIPKGSIDTSDFEEYFARQFVPLFTEKYIFHHELNFQKYVKVAYVNSYLTILRKRH